MIKEVKLNEEFNREQEISVKPKLQLITGGKGPTSSDGWLKDLPVGTIFLARPKASRELILNHYMVVKHSDNCTNMRWTLMDGRMVEIWVHTLEFSRSNDHCDTLGEIEFVFEEKEQGEDNGEIHSSVPSEAEGSGGSTESPSGIPAKES